MRNLAIDAERLWGEIMETASIGGTAKGGICRLTLTDLDAEVRGWFKARAEARSRPKGFSTTMRALFAQPDSASPWATTANRLGGIAR